MPSPFQAASLPDSPSYPDAIAWSEENLIAVASGRLITILNPAKINGPRGLIMLSSDKTDKKQFPVKHFPIGVVKREDLLAGCLLPTCLSRDNRPCARSISWSHIGLAPNSGCLLAVCTTDGSVKLYRSPFSEFSAEWVKVADISDLLFDHLMCINFGEVDIPSTKSSSEQAAEDHMKSGCTRNMQDSVSSKGRKRKMTYKSRKMIDMETLEDELAYDENKDDTDEDYALPNKKKLAVCTEIVTFPCSTRKDSLSEVSTMKNKTFNTDSWRQSFQVPKSKGKSHKKGKESNTSSMITARQYASRSAMLSSTVVSWSPVLHLPHKSDSRNLNNLSRNCSLLAVGGKSGKISIWRINEPDCYSAEEGKVSNDVMLIGLLGAHNGWITGICWEICGVVGSNSQVILATGSSDGSVKVWLGDAEGLFTATKVTDAPFCLLKEVIDVTSIPVSVLSSTVPVGAPGKMLLAIGKGSGSLDVWIFDISLCEFQSAGSYGAHNQVVTGLAWAFSGRCLYSCSQDNSMACWLFDGSSLSEVVIPSNSLGHCNSGDLPDASDSCFGIAISSGNLVLAVARGFDADLLNPMYQARTQKAAVEFFWIGGQQQDLSSDENQMLVVEPFPGVSRTESTLWESNILWSLKQYEHLDKPLVIWDVIAALSACMNSSPTYLQHILHKWLSSWYGGCDLGDSTEKILLHTSRSMSKLHSRQLHLLNIICRRLALAGDKADMCDDNHHNLDEVELLDAWSNLLVSSERELRERLVALNFAVVSSRDSSATDILTGRHCHPVGVAQMEQWVAINHDEVQGELKLLALEVQKLSDRLHSIPEYIVEETCTFCSAPVHFKSPEVDFCVGVKHQTGEVQRHKLSRCAVSMQVCPPTPLWYCVCCHRWISKLAPQILFSMSEFPLDSRLLIESYSPKALSRPWCPFCGILLQRLQPEFLLSASPV